MKTFKLNLVIFAAFALLLTSCSKEEETPLNSETSVLSFAALLNDFADEKDALKQALEDMPECSDATPAFVEVVLTGPENVGSMNDPLVVAVNPNPGNFDDDPEEEYFTEEMAELELEPGAYTLEFFAVYDADPDLEVSNLIWLAPSNGGGFAGLMDSPLPMDFDLGPGAKKYLDVEVLCFDDRVVNEYGYQFFDIENTEAIEFCVFGNFCPPSGRHYPAAYTVEVWNYEDGVMGDLLDTGGATVALDENNDYAASPVCMMLPDPEGLDEYYIEITLTDSDAYGDVQERVVRSGVFNDAEVRSLFDGENNLDYYHFRVGCEDADTPPIFQDPEDDAVMYKSCLTELNDSDVVAFAYMTLEDNVLETHVYGFNLEANQVHMQHIHGFDDSTENSTCPPDWSAGDAGVITMDDIMEFSGGAKIALTDSDGDYPTADMAGMTEYHRTFTLGSDGIISAADLGPLENRTVVMHGMTWDGEYSNSLPVACAEIVRVD